MNSRIFSLRNIIFIFGIAVAAATVLMYRYTHSESYLHDLRMKAEYSQEEILVPKTVLAQWNGEENSPPPRPPFLVSACEFERCETRISDRLICDSVIVSESDIHSHELGKLNAGEIIKAQQLYTLVLKFGHYTNSEETTAEVLFYNGEGEYTIRNREGIDSRQLSPEEFPNFVKPLTEGRSFVKSRRGTEGWVRRIYTAEQECPFAIDN